MTVSSPRGASYRGLMTGLAMMLAAFAMPAAADEDDASADETAAPKLVPICVRGLDGRECGLLDRAGRWAVTPRYEALYARADGWRFTQDYKQGLLDADGKPAIEARYETLGVFHDGWAEASTGFRHNGYIDRRGEWVVPAEYFIVKRMAEGRAPVCQWIGGPNSGHSSCRYIGRDGKPAFDGEFEAAEPFEHGMAVVQPIGSNALTVKGRRIGVLDTEGHALVGMATRYSLKVIGSNRLLEATSEHYALLDRHGKTLFEVPRAGLLKPAGAGLIAYSTRADHKYGLRRIDSLKIVVPEAKGYSWPLDFNHGVAVALAPKSGDQPRRMLIDPHGRTLVKAGRYRGFGRFFDGVGPASPESGHWQLIDVEGKALTPARYSRIYPAWKSAEQTYREGDVWSAMPIDKSSDEIWIDSKGRTLASREKLDCGIEVIKDADGQIIWPHEVEARCAIASGHTKAGESKASPARIEALQLERARKRLKQIRQTTERMHARGARSDESRVGGRVRQAPWQQGPRTVALGHRVTLDLPGGFMYLAPDYVPALQDMIAARMHKSRPRSRAPAFGLIAKDDMTEVFRVSTEGGDTARRLARAGDARAMFDAVNSRVSGLSGVERDDEHLSDDDWIRRPRWSAANRRLSWAYTNMKIRLDRRQQAGVAMDRYGYATSVNLFDDALAALQAPIGQGYFTTDATRVALADIDKLAAGLSAPAVEISDDDTAAAGAAKAPAKSYGDRNAHPARHSKSQNVVAAVIVLVFVLLLGLVVFARRRARKTP